MGYKLGLEEVDSPALEVVDRSAAGQLGKVSSRILVHMLFRVCKGR